MRGKKTNITIGIVNILVGIAFIIYTYIFSTKAPSFTRYNNQIFEIIRKLLLGILSGISILNIIYAIINIKEGHIFIYYIMMLFSLILFIDISYYYTIPTLFSGILLIIHIKKSNFIEKDSNLVLTTNRLMYLVIIGAIALMFLYKPLSNYAMERESVNLLKYDEGFFKYVSPIENEDIYINIKKDGKFGYINSKGEEKIAFKYNYATPYYKIKSFDKEFEVAAVADDNVTHVIMKNGREVMSYNSEYENENYLPKLKEYENVLKETMHQKDPKPETTKDLTYFEKRSRIIPETKEEQELKEEVGYTYMFDFSKRYNILVTESSMGNKTIYKICPKGKTKEAKELDIDNLLYDEDGLYVFKNGYLPYYSVARNVQGWITKTGKKLNVEGKVQILDIEEDRLLVRNFNKNTVNFIDFDAKQIGETYSEVIKDQDRYIVQDLQGKWNVLDKALKPILQNTYDLFDATLLNQGLYIFANLGERLQFNDYGYVKIEYIITNRDWKTIATDINYIYNIYNRYNGTDEKSYVEFVESLKKANINIPSDKFYESYIQKNSKEEVKKEREEKENK